MQKDVFMSGLGYIRQMGISGVGNIQPVSYWIKPGASPVYLYLHGLGCAKDDFFNAAQYDLPGNPTLVAFDFPGCGQSPLANKEKNTIDDLVELTHTVIGHLRLAPLVMIGHSMGGLVGLILAEERPGLIQAFINVEGNLAASDCFFSRHIAAMKEDRFCQKAFPKYVERIRQNTNPGLRRHADILQKYADPRAMHSVAQSLVAYSDEGRLMERFLRLKMPKQFIYGDENHGLPYLKAFRHSPVSIACIPGSNHFPQQDNPDAFYKAVGEFVRTM